MAFFFIVYPAGMPDVLLIAVGHFQTTGTPEL